jgi:flagellar motor switch protein FliN/FliY
MDLVLDLSLDVAIEIGRTKKTVHEVLEYGEGHIIELDKQVADPVDILVNGHLIAKGTVVVIEENFAVRITEIVSPQDKLRAARNRKESN